MTMPRHRFVREFKPKALRLVFNEKHPECPVADELDIPRKVLCGWHQPYRWNTLQETPTESKKEVGADKAGVARLKVALAWSRQGVLLLKKRGIPDHDRPQVRYTPSSKTV